MAAPIEGPRLLLEPGKVVADGVELLVVFFVELALDNCCTSWSIPTANDAPVLPYVKLLEQQLSPPLWQQKSFEPPPRVLQGKKYVVWL